jgi:hypothetical protein
MVERQEIAQKRQEIAQKYVIWGIRGSVLDATIIQRERIADKKDEVRDVERWLKGRTAERNRGTKEARR